MERGFGRSWDTMWYSTFDMSVPEYWGDRGEWDAVYDEAYERGLL